MAGNRNEHTEVIATPNQILEPELAGVVHYMHCSFWMAQADRERYWHAEITAVPRTTVFGLDAAVPYGTTAAEIRGCRTGDSIAEVKAGYAEDPQPRFLTYGPRTSKKDVAMHRCKDYAP